MHYLLQMFPIIAYASFVIMFPVTGFVLIAKSVLFGYTLFAMSVPCPRLCVILYKCSPLLVMRYLLRVSLSCIYRFCIICYECFPFLVMRYLLGVFPALCVIGYENSPFNAMCCSLQVCRPL